jgi:hypothetical protein
MTDRDTVITVIRYLGRIAIVLALGFLALTGNLLFLAGKSGSVDPVAVGSVGAVGSALTFVLGALGAMLVSTRSDDSPQQVTVMNPPTEPVLVEPA